MYPRSSAVVGLDRIAYEAMWAVHLGRTYGTGQHRHKKWSVLQTVMARAGYDSTPHSQPAASGPHNSLPGVPCCHQLPDHMQKA